MRDPIHLYRRAMAAQKHAERDGSPGVARVFGAIAQVIAMDAGLTTIVVGSGAVRGDGEFEEALGSPSRRGTDADLAEWPIGA